MSQDQLVLGTSSGIRLRWETRSRERSELGSCLRIPHKALHLVTMPSLILESAHPLSEHGSFWKVHPLQACHVGVNTGPLDSGHLASNPVVSF